MKKPWPAAPTFALAALEGFQEGGAPWKALQPHVQNVLDGLGDRVLDKKAADRALRVVGAQVYWRYGRLLRKK